MARMAMAVLALVLTTASGCKSESESEPADEAFAEDAAAFAALDDAPWAMRTRDGATSAVGEDAELEGAAAGAATAFPAAARDVTSDAAAFATSRHGVTSAAQLPLFTDPVVGEAGSAGGRGIALGLVDDGAPNADDGGLADAFQRTPDASYAACETARAARAFFSELAFADERLCGFKSVLAALGTRALDGKSHAVRLPGGDGAPDHARFRALRIGADGALADVSVALCVAGRQMLSARYELTDTQVTLTAKLVRGRGFLSVTTRAGLTADGRLADAKTLRLHAPGVATEATQTSDELQMSRAAELRLMAHTVLFDANVPGARYALANLALGDGAALIADGAAAIRQGWSGDTWEATEAVPQLARLADVRGDELLAARSGETAGFDADEAYGCDKAEDLVPVDTDAFAFCPDLTLPQGRMDCRAVTMSTAATRR